MTDLTQALFEMDVYGFTLVENVLSPDEVEAARETLIRCQEKTGHEQKFLGTAGHVSNLPTQDPVFFPMIDHPKVLPIVEGVLGAEIVLGSLNARIVRQTDPQQGLHSDIRESLLNFASPVMVNTVWLLDDFSEANGGTRIVAGTHKSGMAGPPQDREVKHIFQLEAPAGSVLVFNGQCWHGGGLNQTERNRHALFGHYRKNILMFQVDPHDNFPAEWFDQLNDRQKALLRMTNGLGVPHASDGHMRTSFANQK